MRKVAEQHTTADATGDRDLCPASEARAQIVPVVQNKKPPDMVRRLIFPVYSLVIPVRRADC
jgi:hypothetical protein